MNVRQSVKWEIAGIASLLSKWVDKGENAHLSKCPLAKLGNEFKVVLWWLGCDGFYILNEKAKIIKSMAIGNSVALGNHRHNGASQTMVRMSCLLV